MKKKYATPELVIVKIEDCDIITDSQIGSGDGQQPNAAGASKRGNSIWD